MYPSDPTAYGGCSWGYKLEIEYKAPGSGWLYADFDGLSPWPSSVTLTTADHNI